MWVYGGEEAETYDLVTLLYYTPSSDIPGVTLVHLNNLILVHFHHLIVVHLNNLILVHFHDLILVHLNNLILVHLILV